MLRNGSVNVSGVKRVILRWLLVAIATWAGLCVLLFAARNRLLFPVRGSGTGAPASAGMPDGRRVTIVTADGEQLAAWYLPPRDSTGRSGAVLWLHGNGETVDGLGPILRGFRPPRAAMLAVDYRGYGGSSGHPTAAGVLRDAEAAFDWLAARPEVDAARIVVYGRSIGAAPAAHVASVRPAAGLILESAFTSLRAMVRRQFPWAPAALAPAAFDNLAALGRVTTPILLIHGDRDEVVPPAMGRALAASVGARAELWIIGGAGHNETYDAGGEEYVRRFHDFVARHAEESR
jgi:hypothetical protein